jgi:phosphotransferase system enzyme I (PtsI)
MEAAAIPEIKEALRRVTLAEVRVLADKALTCESSEDVTALLHQALGERMADLIAGVTEVVL